MAKLWQFLEGHPKPAFSEKVQRGDQEKFFKNRPESSPRFNGPNPSGANVIIPKLHPLIMQRLKKILAQKAAPKLPEWPSYGNFGRVTPKSAFSKKRAKGDQGKFVKNRPKSSPRLKGAKAIWRKWHYLLISMHVKCKDCRRFRRKRRL